MIEKHSTAIWTGSLKEGAGKLNSQSGVLADTPYTFATRFENGKGCNPEELVAAAHSSCYAMFLSALMSGAGIVPETVEARSTVKLDPTTEGGPTSGYSPTGSNGTAISPAAKITIDSTAAKIGRSMKKREKSMGGFPGWEMQRARHCPGGQ